VSLKIVTANERMAGPRGVKALIMGPPGVGKTSLLRTVNPSTTLFCDLEAGDLSVQDVPVDTLRPKAWPECRDIACLLGGPNPSLPADAAYSHAHYEAVCERLGAAEELEKYSLYFVDSITVAARLCFRWAQQQPEAFSEKTGKPDPRGAYGLLGREMIGWLSQLQHSRSKNVVLVGILEHVTDDFNRGGWQLQIDGSKTGRELPGIVDQMITYQFVQFEDGIDPVRALVCQQPNPFSYPAKDRSGRLELYEKPNLGELIEKVTSSKHNLTQAA
jgi:AAA domain